MKSALLGLLLAAIARSQTAPEAFATSGNGAEQSPWKSSTDFTGGLQTAVDRLNAGRGGEVRLAAGRYDFDSPGAMLTIHQPGIRMSCAARGYSVDPNGVAEGRTGCKIKVLADGSAITITQNKGQPRVGGLDLDGIYIWGRGAAACPYPFTGCSGVLVTGDLDQVHFNNMVFANLASGLTLAAGGSMDAAKIQNSSFDGNGTGISLQGTDHYTSIQDNIIADNSLQGLAANPTNTINRVTVSGNVFVRNCSACTQYSANVLWAQSESRIVDNNFSEAGGLLNNSAIKADQLLIYGHDNIVEGNFFGYSPGYKTLPENNAGVHIMSGANRNMIGPNRSSNQPIDILIEAGANDTIVAWPGAKIVDHGTRTVINNFAVNAGDPDMAGDWKNAPKYAGLTIRDTVGAHTWLYTGGGRIPLGN
jgi:hypothetical protein